MKKSKILHSIQSLLLVGLIVACAPAKAYKPVTLERSAQETARYGDKESAVGKIVPLKVEEINISGARTPLPEKQLPPRQPITYQGFVMTDTPVMINAEKMPLSAFIIYALGETLKLPFVMDEQVMNMSQTISLRMPGTMPPAKAFEVVLGLLEKQGLFLEAQAGTLYIMQKAPEAKTAMDIRIGRNIVDSSADILQVVPLRYIRRDDIEPIFRDIYKASSVQVKSYPRENMLLLYGKAFQIRQIIELIEIFDVPALSNKKVMLIRLTYWPVDDFIRQMTSIMNGTGYSIVPNARETGAVFVPIRQMNSILIVSPDEQTAKYILEWKEKLDNPAAAGVEEKPFIYRPRYTKASDLVLSISNLYSAADTAAKTATAAKAAIRHANMSADDRTNIIMVVAPPAVYQNLLELLTGLDIPAKQVLIEAMIVELTLTDDLKYGVEWWIKDTQQGGNYTLGTIGGLGLGTAGLSYSFVSQTANFMAAIDALANLNKVNILSTPRLTVLDNRDATIQVGQDVPTVTSEIATPTATTTTQAAVVRTIQYRSTGVMVKVKPTINTGGLLTLDIAVEVSEIGAPGVSDSPIILARKLNTAIVVAHGQTIALGGLMKDNESETEAKVPLLGDIPLLGHLFKYTTRSKIKTELLILVTPTILTGKDDADKITGELRKELPWFK